MRGNNVSEGIGGGLILTVCQKMKATLSPSGKMIANYSALFKMYLVI